jgi:hypothetical protein
VNLNEINTNNLFFSDIIIQENNFDKNEIISSIFPHSTSSSSAVQKLIIQDHSHFSLLHPPVQSKSESNSDIQNTNSSNKLFGFSLESSPTIITCRCDFFF